jgi:hypothetical protein
MRASPNLPRVLICLMIVMTVTTVALGADPGLTYPPSSEASDQKAGSVLFFNFYTSSFGSSENTQISVTNTSPATNAFVNLFFVNGTTGSATSISLSLTPNHTLAFSTLDIDPGVSGYIVAVAVNDFGCPISFNFLRGNARVNLSSGHVASLGAIAFSALYSDVLPGCNGTSTTAALVFDGGVNGYNRLPRMLAIDKIRSYANNNSMLLVLNRFGGSFVSGAGTLGSMAGLLFNDTPNSFPFTFVSNSCQFRTLLSDGFPQTSLPFSAVITGGRSGWMKLYAVNDVGLLGAAINFNDM